MNTRRQQLMFLALFLGFLCAGKAHAQEWWQGSLGPAPPTPSSSPVYEDDHGRSEPSYRRERDDYRPRREKPRDNRPKPPSRAELARREKERKREEVQKQQIQGELARLSGSFQIQRVQPDIELTPRGSDVPADTGVRPFGQIMVAQLSGVGTPASRIPVENLRRAAAILAPIMQAVKAGNMDSMSEEDMSFLASQSALAMEGAPLSVEIRDVPAGREDAIRRLAQQAQDIGTVQAEMQRATAERLRVEEQLVNVQKELQSDKGNKQALENQREKILRAYKTAYIAEADKKAEVKSMTGKVTYVWDTGAR